MSEPADTLLSDTDIAEMTSDPYEAVKYRLGMLLALDDFETEQGYHRGKHQLHAAWQHGAGVVWGLTVKLRGAEIVVSPGLAIDGRGRELHLEREWCLPVKRFVDESAGRFLPRDAGNGRMVYDARVVARFAANWNRSRPTLNAADDGAAAATRTRDAIVLELVPRRAEDAPDRFTKVRSLFQALPAFGDSSHDDDVEAWRSRIQSELPQFRAAYYRRALRDLAVADGEAARPRAYGDNEGARAGEESFLQPDHDAEVVLAEVVEMSFTEAAVSARISTSHRSALLSTSLLQDLLCSVMANTTPPLDAGGPRVTHALFRGNRVIFHFSKPIHAGSAHPDAFGVAVLTGNQWQRPEHTVQPAVKEHYEFDQITTSVRHDLVIGPRGIVEETAKTFEELRIDLKTFDPTRWTLKFEADSSLLGAAELVRVIVHGTGLKPLLGVDLLPLAGGMHSGAGDAHSGIDFVGQARPRRGRG